MEDWLAHIFEALLRTVGACVEGASHRTQALVLLGICAVFVLIAGCLFQGLAATLCFVIAGTLGVLWLWVLAGWVG